MIFDVLQALLGATIALKSGLEALGSTFELFESSWSLSTGSSRRLGALLEALGALLECFKRGDPHRG